MGDRPMPTGPYTAKDWRDRAEEARARAEEMRGPRARQIMLEIAEGYDRLAQMAEKHARVPG